MSVFTFHLGQRVIVPNTGNQVQGVIGLPAGPNEFEADAQFGRFTYLVRWIGEDGERYCAWFGEEQLKEAAACAREFIEGEIVKNLPPAKSRKRR